MTPCPICRRASRGFVINVPEPIHGHTVHHFCSIEHAMRFLMSDPITQDETKAALAGGQQAGEYLESIGVFDLRQMSAEQWEAFCGKLFSGACDALAEQAKSHVPY